MSSTIRLVLILIFVAGFVSAQNLDSLYNEFLYLHNKIEQIETPTIQGGITGGNRKCGFGLVNDIKQNLDNFSPKKQSILKTLLARPKMQTSMVTPSGYVRIHYDTTGSSKPNYKLRDKQKITPPLSEIMDSLAAAVDSAYNYEVNVLGYPAPPNDNGMGGDELYDIYVDNMGSGYYGSTYPENQIGSNTSTSYTIIDNDFASSSYASKGLAGAKVTVAHELHHGIQIGNYLFRSSDRFYHEITSTAMEEFVFDEVNDYYAYMENYFNDPSRRFAANPGGNEGYDLAIWNIFLKERYDFTILKRIWEIMRAKKAVVAIAEALNERGESFKEELNEFGIWCYFTNYRAKPELYFEEGVSYPLISPMNTYTFYPPKKQYTITSNPISNNYHFFVFEDTESIDDTLVSIITNCDISSEISDNKNTIQFDYILASSNSEGFKKLRDNIYSKIVANDNDLYLLSEMNIYNHIEINPETEFRNEEFVYPQPFKYQSGVIKNRLKIPAPKSSTGEIELYVYSVDMNLVFSGPLPSMPAGDFEVIKWDGMDTSGEKLPSGVYIYIAKSYQATKKGKLVIQNE